MGMQGMLSLAPRAQIIHERPFFDRKRFETVLASDGLTTLTLVWEKGEALYQVRHDKQLIGFAKDYDYAHLIWIDVRSAH